MNSWLREQVLQANPYEGELFFSSVKCDGKRNEEEGEISLEQ
jgi:hypothetical protein